MEKWKPVQDPEHESEDSLVRPDCDICAFVRAFGRGP